MSNLNQLPDNLPVPVDDGACDHLTGARLPSMSLLATDGKQVNLSSFDLVVIYCYPMTGRPDRPLPTGWDDIPGARGCTPQSCAFRDSHQTLAVLGAQVFGVSTQTSTYQQEVQQRLHLPYALLSDHSRAFAKALNLPTFSISEQATNEHNMDENTHQQPILLKRVTLIARHGLIEKVFYPVFPPHKNADDVLAYLQAYAKQGSD